MSKTCNGCRGETSYVVPYVAHESSLSRAERTMKRQWVSIVILIMAIIVSNVTWLCVFGALNS
jgi:hypothetical protein